MFYVKYIKWFLFSRNYVGRTDFFFQTQGLFCKILWTGSLAHEPSIPPSPWTSHDRLVIGPGFPLTGLLRDEILVEETREGAEAVAKLEKPARVGRKGGKMGCNCSMLQ
jgi:hypothetical protein